MSLVRILSVIEHAGKLVRKTVVRDGKKQTIKVREYSTECPDGYKRDSETGKCVRMSPEERRNRSIAATRSANKSSTKRNKNISQSRRKSLVKD